MGDPEKMYSIARKLRDDFATMQASPNDLFEVKLGLNMGAIKMLEGINNKRNCVDVVINDAERVMSFAGPNQLLVSKLYFDTITSLSAEYSSIFNRLSNCSDKHNEIHEVYELVGDIGSAISSALSLADFCSTITDAIDSKDDRYEFKTFTRIMVILNFRAS